MKRVSKSICVLLAATTLIPSFKAEAQSAEEIIGGVIGGTLGGLLGNGLSEGDALATGAGAVIGTILGMGIARELEEADRRAAIEATNRAMRAPVNQRVPWDGSYYGSRSGARGSVYSTSEYRNSNGLRCRSYVSEVHYRNRIERNEGSLCQYPDGSWREWNQQTVTPTYPQRPMPPQPVPMPVPQPYPPQMPGSPFPGGSELFCQNGLGGYQIVRGDGLRIGGTFESRRWCQQQIDNRSNDLVCTWSGNGYQPHRVRDGVAIGFSGSGFRDADDCWSALANSNRRNGAVCVWAGREYVSFHIQSGAPINSFGRDFDWCLATTEAQRGGRRR